MTKTITNPDGTITEVVETPGAEGNKTDKDEDSLKEINANLIEEIKTIRKERSDEKAAKLVLEAKLAELTKGPEGKTEVALDEDVVAKKVDEVLKNKEKEKAKSNKAIALEKFVTENKQFSPDNDPTGMKREALERKLARFNTEGLTEVTDFYAVIEDAFNLLGKPGTAPENSKVENPYSSTSVTPSAVRPAPKEELTQEEKVVADRLGWSAEKLLKFKVEKPDFYDSLFAKR